MIDPLARQLVVGRLPVRCPLRRRDVALDAQDGERVIAGDAILLKVPIGEGADPSRHEKEKDREQRCGAALAARTVARGIRTAWKRRRSPRHQLEADRHGLPHRLRCGQGRGADRLRDLGTPAPDGFESRANALRDEHLCGLGGRWLGDDPACRAGRGAHLDEDRGGAADDAVRDGAVVDVLGRRARVERDRGILQRFGAEALDERARSQNERVARLDALAPHVGQHIGDAAERLCFPRRGAMYEVGELARFVAREEEASASHEKDLRCADPRRVELVVHDDRARAVECDTSALIAKALCGPAIRLPQRFAERDLDPRGEVVVVLLTSEVGDLLRDVAAGITVLPRDLAQEVEAPLRP